MYVESSSRPPAPVIVVRGVGHEIQPASPSWQPIRRLRHHGKLFQCAFPIRSQFYLSNFVRYCRQFNSTGAARRQWFWRTFLRDRHGPRESACVRPGRERRGERASGGQYPFAGPQERNQRVCRSTGAQLAGCNGARVLSVSLSHSDSRCAATTRNDKCGRTAGTLTVLRSWPRAWPSPVTWPTMVLVTPHATKTTSIAVNIHEVIQHRQAGGWVDTTSTMRRNPPLLNNGPM